ncbi:MAG TPA: uL30 family ribosomal protein [Thermoplasmata archaeon]|nr:uL30 family ribosomal protein [Thermoplasmata archaeon]
MIIRVRGTIHARHDIVATLHHLRLNRPNHATVVPEEPHFRGMIHKVQGYVTWGEADPATVAVLVEKRGTPAADATSPAASNGPNGSAGMLPIYRLHPPKGGWRSTKKPFARGGALGYRGAAINDLARKMV